MLILTWLTEQWITLMLCMGLPFIVGKKHWQVGWIEDQLVMSALPPPTKEYHYRHQHTTTESEKYWSSFFWERVKRVVFYPLKKGKKIQIEGLLWVRPCSVHFTHISLFNSHKSYRGGDIFIFIVWMRRLRIRDLLWDFHLWMSNWGLHPDSLVPES